MWNSLDYASGHKVPLSHLLTQKNKTNRRYYELLSAMPCVCVCAHAHFEKYKLCKQTCIA